MEDNLNREPVTQSSQSVSTHTEHLGGRNIVTAIFGIIEFLIGFRFVLKLLGANSENGFVQFIYNITGFFVDLFKGIFAEVAIGNGNAVFEPASIIALLIVAIVAWIIFKLMTPKKDKHVEQTNYTSNTGRDNR